MESLTRSEKAIILFLIIICSLFLGPDLFYNQNEKIFAVEENEGVTGEEPWRTLKCEEEIPIGLAIDEAFSVAKEVADSLNQIMTLSSSQIREAEELFDLPNQCKAEGNCTSNCHEHCSDTDGDGEDECNCDQPDCTGTPCPTAIATKASLIEGYYNDINTAYKKIDDTINLPAYTVNVGIATLEVSKADLVHGLLEDSREKMSSCVVSAEVTAEDISGGILLKCDEADVQGALSEDRKGVCSDAQQYLQMTNEQKKSCCYVNNFFCCQ
jgi:hypothetical protein